MEEIIARLIMTLLGMEDPNLWQWSARAAAVAVLIGVALRSLSWGVHGVVEVFAAVLDLLARL